MSAQFQLTRFHDMWLVTFLVEGIEKPLYLAHMSAGPLGWTNDQLDAKRFQYRRDAIKYTLEHTKLKRYRQPIGTNGAYLEVRFDEQKICLGQGVGPARVTYQTLTFAEATAIHDLPIFLPKEPTP